ncbi:MAG: putative maltokinase [Candidatus Rokubacteria bacterium]|nr:putative maltokinase [Candidatus Rokubacteria bacterium]
MASKTPRSSRAGRPAAAAVGAALDRFAAERLAEALPRQRWFGGKGRRIVAVAVRDAAPLGDGAPDTWLTLVDVAFDRGPGETCVVPLRVRGDGPPDAEGLGWVDLEGAPARVTDALGDPAVGGALLAAFAEARTLRARRGTISFVRAPAFPASAVAGGLAARRLSGEQSNTSIVYGEALILKVFRKPEAGPNPEHEMTGFLTARGRFAHVPQLAGAVEYAPADGEGVTLAVLHRFTPNHGDGFTWVLGHLGRLAEFVATRAEREPLGGERVVQLVRDFSAGLLGAMRRLGALTGGLHAALASDPGDPAFAPEPIGAGDVARWTERIAGDLALTLEVLRACLPDLPAPARGRAEALLADEAGLTACLGGLDALPAEGCAKIRIHGDYHLGQTLRTDDDFVVLDFEGEPARPLAERRAKHSPLRDVAGMVRSLDYAAATAFGDSPAAAAAGATWRRLAVDAFLDAYLAEAAGAPARLAPAARPALARALAPFALDKALYEVRYEIDHRPAWVAVPLRGLDRLRAAGGMP